MYGLKYGMNLIDMIALMAIVFSLDVDDMNEMVGIIRNTGNQNIILVPC
jgi:hypothetical protein